MVPFGADFRIHSLPLFLSVLMEKLNAKERAALIKAVGLTKADVNAWQKLDGAAKKLERELKSAKLQKASQLYQVLIKAPGELVLYLTGLFGAAPGAGPHQELLPEVSAAIARNHRRDGGGHRRRRRARRSSNKVKEEMILTRLDARPKKPAPEPEPPPPPPPMSSFARGPSPRHSR